jgi:endonuclease III
MSDLPISEKNKIVMKWFSFIDSTTNDIEDRRFQVLVAARLHARCQEAAVRKAMQNLNERINPLTVNTVAVMDPLIISDCISNLQYHNTKAKQIVQASKEVLSQYNGIVPEEERELRMLTGIGPVFADLLSHVNTREMHTLVNNEHTERNHDCA